MLLTLDQIYREAIQLPVSLRAGLADRLIGSLDTAEDDEVVSAWTREAQRRRVKYAPAP